MRLNTAGLRTRAILANLTACGFGIYLEHYLFVGAANMLINALHVPLPLVCHRSFPCYMGSRIAASQND